MAVMEQADGKATATANAEGAKFGRVAQSEAVTAVRVVRRVMWLVVRRVVQWACERSSGCSQA